MRQIKIDYEIDCPPDDLFAALTDFAALPTWRSVEIIRLEPPGPAQAGSHVFSAVRTIGRRMRFENEITVLDPRSRYYADRFVNGSFAIQSSWWVQPRNSGSLLTWTTDYEATGLMAFIPGLAARRIHTGQMADLERLKAKLEGR